MIDRYQLPFSFDPISLHADLARIGEDEWVPHFNKDYYEGDWSGVVLRSAAGKTGSLFTNAHATESFIGTPILERCPYFQQVLATFQCPLKSVRLLRLSAGSVVREHRDYDLGYAEGGEVRFHIPIQTNPNLEFHLNNRRVILGEGEVWYLDLAKPHRVRNRGTTPRIHLVLDMQVNDWLRSQVPFESPSEFDLESTNDAAIAPDDAARNLQQFRQLVYERPDLQEVLRDTTDRELFLQEMIRLGHQNNYFFTSREVDKALQAERQKWFERWIA